MAPNPTLHISQQWQVQDFPEGGVDLIGGGVDSQGSYVS